MLMPKLIYVWQVVILNILGFNYMLSPNRHESNNLLDPTPFDLALFKVQVGMSVMLGDTTLFVHFDGF
jgi:hypothetical protein